MNHENIYFSKNRDDLLTYIIFICLINFKNKGISERKWTDISGFLHPLYIKINTCTIIQRECTVCLGKLAAFYQLLIHREILKLIKDLKAILF